MSSFLSRILQEKEKEVQLLKQECIPLNNRIGLSLIQAIKEKNPIGIIAEIKRKSPSKGALNEGVDPVLQAKQYEEAGAAAISVLTDAPFFNGSFLDLEAVRNSVSIPVLCKDFILDPVQIRKAKAVGADAILLIVAALEQEQLKSLYREALNLGLEVLVEVHDETELMRALEIRAKLIGINNRDLTTFNVSLQTTVKLANLVSAEEITLISESGIVGQGDVRLVKEAGARGVLVGETLMKTKDIRETMRKLSLKGVEFL